MLWEKTQPYYRANRQPGLIYRCVHIQDLATWRARLDSQVNDYESEIGGLRTSVDTEVKCLRREFKIMRDDMCASINAMVVAATL